MVVGNVAFMVRGLVGLTCASGPGDLPFLFVVAARRQCWSIPPNVGDRRATIGIECSGAMCPSVLVVEDDEQGRKLLVRILQGQGGYGTDAAANAAEARALLAERTYQAALIDYRMPGESGIELLKHVRARFPDAAAIMVTAVDDAESVELALQIGAYGYVVKPYRVSELLINL